jgi:NitT/TauT family transport system permease protein
MSVVTLWFAIVEVFRVPPFIAPGPVEVVRVIAANWSLLLRNLVPTLQEALAGFVLGNSLAIGVAIVFVHNRVLQRMYFPIATLFNTVPIIAISPILILIFGLGLASKVIIAGIICFFPTLVNMIRGFESVSVSELELMRVLSASTTEVFFKLRVPRSLPFLFSALRITSASCVIGAIVGEWIGSTQGLGAVIIQATFNYRSGLLYAAICVSSSVAILLFSLVVLVERRVVRWTPQT